MNWRSWRWLDGALLPLVVDAMRICWVWPWLEMLQSALAPSAGEQLVPFMALIALLVGGMVTARIALAGSGNLRRARAWVAAVGLLAVLGLIWWQYGRASFTVWDLRWLRPLVSFPAAMQAAELPAPLLTFLIAAAAWLRGVYDGRQEPIYDDVQREFIVGSVALAVLLLVMRLDAALSPTRTNLWMLAFFATGMCALAFASLQHSRITGRSERDAPLRLNRYWLASVATVIAALLAIGLLISVVVAPDTVARLLAWTSIVADLVWRVVGSVLYVIIYVIFLVIGPLIEWLQSLTANAQPLRAPEMAELQKQLEPLTQPAGLALSPLAVESIRWLVIVGLAVIVVLAFALALRYFRSNEEESVEEERELIFTGGLLRDQLAALLQRWRQRGPQRTKDVDPFVGLDGVEANRRELRLIYRSFLAVARSVGLAHAPEQTPAEYAAVAKQVLESATGALERLTTGYVQARYADVAPTPDQVHSAQEALHSIQEQFAAFATQSEQTPNK